MRLEMRPTTPMIPAHELTTVSTSKTEASHAADVAQRARKKEPAAATKPTTAVPIDAPPMTIRATPTRPTAEGSVLKLRTKKPHKRRRNEPARIAFETQ